MAGINRVNGEWWWIPVQTFVFSVCLSVLVRIAVRVLLVVLVLVLVLGCCVVGALFANVSVTYCVMSCMTSGVAGVRSKLCLLSAWIRADIFLSTNSLTSPAV